MSSRPTSSPGAEPAGVRRRSSAFARVGKTVAATIASALFLAGLASVPAASAAQAVTAAADEEISSFTLGVLPDTQFYSRYATTEEGKQFQTRYGTEPFSSQTQWLVDNDQDLGMPFVAHLGDIVDQVAKPDQWAVASNAMKILEDGGLPYSISTGNHDVSADWQTDAQRNPASEPFLSTFSPARAATKNPTTFGGRDPLGYSEWHVFEKDGTRYLVMALTWNASDATIAWAQGVFDAHKDMPTIVTSHQLLNIAPSGVGPAETDFGLKIWNRLISPNNQIFMTVNGHHHGNANWTKTNAAGNPVLQVVNDYQMAYQGGNGYLGLYEFDFSNSQIRASQVSPWVVTKSLVLVNQFDQAVLRKPNERYNVPFDLTKRFTEIKSDFVAGPADHTSYTEKAVELLYANYTEPVVPERETADNEDDYFHAANTVAHWTFNGTDGASVGVGETITDTEGTNPLKRAKLINGAELSDVKYSNVSHPLAANQGSVCFTKADRDTKRMSYFSTAANTPLTKERFPNGYTIETFIKVDESWTQEKNRWMSALAAGGTRVAGSGDGEAPPFFMGISNLLEVQWSVDPTNAVAKTNWSGEISKDVWLHVAAVNDTATQTTTLYIEGAPVLRNSNGGVTGIETILGAAWKLGASSDYGTPDGGFLGCIGETRIVAEPLSADQWLTSRAVTESTETNSVRASDNFDRHNGALGNTWVDARGAWAVKGKDAVVADSLGGNVASYTGTELGDEFTVTSTLSHASQNGNAQWVGAAFNVSGNTPSALSYYQLRYAPNWAANGSNRWQLIKVIDGATATVVREGTFAANPTKPIDVTIHRDADVVDVTLEDYLGQAVLETTVTLTEFPARRGGFAGLASNDADLIASAFAVKSSADAVVASAPELTAATVTDRSVAVAWDAPENDGGSPVTGYVATLSAATVVGGDIEIGDDVASKTVAATVRESTFTGLAAGSYVARVTATNAVGSSAGSERSELLTVSKPVDENPGEENPGGENPGGENPGGETKSESTVAVTTKATTYGTAASVAVAVKSGSAAANGDVVFYLDGKSVATKALAASGAASISLPATLAVGSHAITAEYLGTTTALAADKAVTLKVGKAAAVAKLVLSKSSARVKKAAPSATVTVTVPGTSVKASGKVQLLVNGKVVKTASLSSKGVVKVALPKFTRKGSYTVTAKFVGNANVTADSSSSLKVRVTK